MPYQYQNEFLKFIEDNPNKCRADKLSYISKKSDINIEELINWFRESLFNKKVDLFKPDYYFLENLNLHHSAIISAAPLEDLLSIAGYEFIQNFSSEGVFSSCKDKTYELSKLKVKFEDICKKFIFIGDTPSDMKSAKKAKFEFIPISKWSCYYWPIEIYPYQLDNLNNLFENPICQK